MQIETIAVHAGHHVDAETGAVASPIHLSTTFERDVDGEYPRGFVYGRSDNPNRASLERVMADLEGGATARAFASGLGAAAAVFQSLRPGDHVVAPREVYHGVRTLLDEVFTPWGLRVSYAPLHEEGALASAMTPETRLVWVETPANPMLQITDLRAAAEVAHAKGVLVACDNTFMTPVMQRPLAVGADVVVHATTKWIGGHSDHTGGVVVCARDDEFAARVQSVQELAGGVMSPFDAWLACRGARSLACRVRASTESAGKIAAALADHPRVERVLYPGLADHPGHALAKRQMDGFGGIVSVCVDGDRQRAMDVAGRLRIFTRATSLGGVESLVEHRESIEGPKTTTPANLLRLSIGLENAQDLIDDLDQALQG